MPASIRRRRTDARTGGGDKTLALRRNCQDVFGCNITEPVVSLPDVYAAFSKLLNAHFRPEYRLGRLKEFTHYFAQNYKFGHSLACRVQSSSSMDEARERAGNFLENFT